MWNFCLYLCLGYLVLTVLGTRVPLIPDLLIVMVLFTGQASLWRTIGYGFITGLLLDISTGLGLYHIASYTLAGSIIGIIPSTILQTPLATNLFNTILGTLIIHLSYGLFTKIFIKQLLLMPWPMLLGHILLNCLLVWSISAFISWNRGTSDEIR